MRPLSHCVWQRVEVVAPTRLEDDAGPTPGLTQQARAAGSTLYELGRRAERTGGMVPDGTVPTALVDFLHGVGVRRGDAREAAAFVVADTAEAIHWAELTLSRRTAAQLHGLGLHMPDLLGDAIGRKSLTVPAGKDVLGQLRMPSHAQRCPKMSKDAKRGIPASASEMRSG